MRFRPCIDLHLGKVKQIVGSTLTDDPAHLPTTNFETNKPPSFFADLYRKDDIKGGHVIMLGSGNDTAAIEALKAFPGGLQVGGGINPQNSEKFLAAGASHVIVTSYVFQKGLINYTNLKHLSGSVGKNRLVIDLSCKRKDDLYYIVTDRWTHFTETHISEKTMTDLAAYCSEFLVHAADVEGKQQGIDEELVWLLGSSSPIPVTYAGGIHTFEDLEQVKLAGQEKVDATIGSALDIFGGKMSYAEVVKWFAENNS